MRALHTGPDIHINIRCRASTNTFKQQLSLRSSRLCGRTRTHAHTHELAQIGKVITSSQDIYYSLRWKTAIPSGRGLTRGSAAACWGGIVGSNPARAMDVCVCCECLCCQVEVSGPGWSLVQRCPTECNVSECDHESSINRRPWPTKDRCGMGKKRL